MLPQINGEMRCVRDAELRFSPSGVAIGTVRVVSNSRKKVNDEWVDDKVCWLEIICFGQQAESIAEVLKQGDLVTFTGRLQTEEWEDREGGKRQSYKIVADTIGKSLPKYGNAGRRAERSSSGGDGDPWAAPTDQSDEPPF